MQHRILDKTCEVKAEYADQASLIKAIRKMTVATASKRLVQTTLPDGHYLRPVTMDALSFMRELSRY